MSFDESQNLTDHAPDDASSMDVSVPRDEQSAPAPTADVGPMLDRSDAVDELHRETDTGDFSRERSNAAESLEAAEPESVEAEEPPYVPRPPVELAEPEPEVPLNWYILKVQSNREESIRDGLLRRVKVAGLEDYFKEIIVPTETVTEFKNGKKRVVKRKLYPGYIVVNMAITDETWFLVRETPGIGDFTGAAGKPSPMLPSEIAKIEQKEKAVETEQPTLSIAFKPGDHVKINEGTFENFEGEVSAVDATNGRITVMINIFGRSTPVELEYWQVESV
jgi:transcriptional antiterminator NusG